MGLQRDLPRPVREFLVLPAALAAVPLRGRERGEERQPLRWYSSRYAAGTLTSSAHTRPAQGIGARIIRLNQRRPVVLTKNDLEERTGSR